MDPRKKTLLNLIGAGLIALGSAGLLNGCGTIYQNDPVVRSIIDNTVPSALQPNSIKDARERMKATENTYDGECINVVIEKEGYTMSKEICENTFVYYKEDKHYLDKLIPPYVELFPPGEGGGFWDPSNKFKVKITDLDMFKK